MLNRKLEAAVLTIFIGYFVMPFLFNDWQDDYFMIGLVVTAYAAPFVFIFGIPISYFIQNRIQNNLQAFVSHGIAGLLLSLGFGIVMQYPLDMLTLILVAGLGYSLLFYFIDWLLQKLKFYIVDTPEKSG